MSEAKWTVVKELHAPARRNFKRRKVLLRDIDDTWQADLVDMSAYSKSNSGFKFLLTVIDTFSKYAWAEPIKTKNGHDVTEAMKKIFKKGRKPKNLHVDAGKEFYNSTFKSLLSEKKIHMYSTFSTLKASICERFNRTLKSKMWTQFSFQGSYNWIDKLSKLLSDYNNSIHRTIGMKPIDVTPDNAKLLKHRFTNILVQKPNYKFKSGDKVRISKYKHVFEKGYTPNWTTEIFTIKAVNNTSPPTYKLEDYQRNPIEGSFYEEELQKVKHPDVYLIEKILKTDGNRMYVKWLGFDKSHNSWINKSDL